MTNNQRGRSIPTLHLLLLMLCTCVPTTESETRHTDTPSPATSCWVNDNSVDFQCAANQIRVCDLSTSACRTRLFPDCIDGWCRVEAGAFLAGRSDSISSWFELPERPITLTRPFEIRATEITLREWMAVMGGDNPTPDIACGNDCPVFGITYFDALEFANRLSEASGLSPCYRLFDCAGEDAGFGRECDEAHYLGPDCPGYRLPSEAEWELAAAFGSGQCVPGQSPEPAFPDGNDPQIDCQTWGPSSPDDAWHCGNAQVAYAGCLDLSSQGGPSCVGPRPVGSGYPSTRGIFGLFGNVAEFTSSSFDWPWRYPPPPYPVTHEVDPGFERIVASGFLGASEDVRERTAMVAKGGNFSLKYIAICSYARFPVPLGRSNGILRTGIRLVRTL